MTTLNETRTGSALTDDEIRAKYEAPFRHGAGLADSRAKRLAAAHFIESLREDGIPISRACRIFGTAKLLLLPEGKRARVRQEAP